MSWILLGIVAVVLLAVCINSFLLNNKEDEDYEKIENYIYKFCRDDKDFWIG